MLARKLKAIKYELFLKEQLYQYSLWSYHLKTINVKGYREKLLEINIIYNIWEKDFNRNWLEVIDEYERLKVFRKIEKIKKQITGTEKANKKNK